MNLKKRLPALSSTLIPVSCAVIIAALASIPGCGNSVEMAATAPGTDSAAPMRASAGLAESESAAGGAVRDASPSGSLPSLDEEVWVIIPNEQQNNASNDDAETPGSGAMLCHLPVVDDSEPQTIPLPLKHTEVRTNISAYVASVDVTQTFHNPYDRKIEAAYVFPLPQNAAVNGFVMTIGDRRIRGIIREREEAEQIYQSAKSRGHTASLLTQERPNIFTQRVANIEPGKTVDIDITYFHTMSYDDGWYEYVFPMVVGPRFNPPGSTDGIGSNFRPFPDTQPFDTTVSYLAPNERSGHDINVTVALDATIGIESIDVRSHDVSIDHESSHRIEVRLDEKDRIPNKDFVLRYKLAGSLVKSGVLTHRDASGAYMSVMLVPPSLESETTAPPTDMIFVIDTSGSMGGRPIEQARAAIDHALTQLRPQDRFQIVRFSNDATTFSNEPVDATRANVRKGRDYVRNLKSGGGTMMISGLRRALQSRSDGERRRIVAFLTDGFIGNDADVLHEVGTTCADARIFSFGVGSSPNRYLMNRMAKLGRGAVAYLGPNDSGAHVMDAFCARISNPILTDIELDWNGLPVRDVLPARAPDLMHGRPVILTARIDADDLDDLDLFADRELTVRGTSNGNRVATSMPINLSSAVENPALEAVWARMTISELIDRATVDPSINVKQSVTELALDHSLMSAWTSFVAVDASRITEGDTGVTVTVPVPIPEGTEYSTAPGSRGQSE